MKPTHIKIEASFVEALMGAALAQARLSYQNGEVPVGASLGYKGKVVASAGNSMETAQDATAHAEMLVLKQAGALVDSWRLKDCVLCVTLEPCTMCAAAIKLARIPVTIFGVSDPRAGALGSLYNLAEDRRWGEELRVISGVKEKECRELLQQFFQERRAQINCH